MESSSFSLENVATLLKLLSDKTRLTIVAILEQQECCVCEFVEAFEMSQPSISQHLRKLKDGGIVKESKKGQWVFYSLNKQSNYYPLISQILEHTPKQDELIDKLIKNSPLKQSCCK
jgi:ArsR family transcriptional regulator